MVVAKSNPVNCATSPVIAKILQPLIDAGYLGFCHGGIPVSSAMVNHPLVDNVILTGAASTYDAIK